MVDRLPAVDDSTKQFPTVVRNVIAQNLANEGAPEGAVVVEVVRDHAAEIVNVKTFGAIGNGVADDTTEIQAAIDATPDGWTLHFPVGEYRISNRLLIDHPMTVTGAGAQVIQYGVGACGFEVTSGGTAFRDLQITGRQFASTVANERGIWAHGASSAAYITGLTVDQCAINNWGQAAVWADFCTDIRVDRTVVYNIRYAGLAFLSCTDGKVTRNNISDVTASQAYGIMMSHLELVDLATNPRTKGFLVDGNLVQRVATWEGIDTHSGENITITNNRVFGCLTGIAAVGSTIVSTKYAPHDVTIKGNIIDSLVTTGAGIGIQFVGADSGVGVVNDYATGAILHNTIRGHGADIAGSGGIVFYDTSGLQVEDNTIIECVPNGVVAYHDNTGFLVANNAITDAWTDARPRALAVLIRSTYNVGRVAGNQMIRGSRSATHVMDYGLEIISDATNVIASGGNGWAGVGAAYLDVGGIGREIVDAALVTVGRTGQKVGFYGATPVVKPAALVQTYSTTNRTLGAYTPDTESVAYTGNPASLALAASLAEVNALRVAYENLRLFVENIAQHHNAVVDDLQAFGLES